VRRDQCKGNPAVARSSAQRRPASARLIFEGSPSSNCIFSSLASTCRSLSVRTATRASWMYLGAFPIGASHSRLEDRGVTGTQVDLIHVVGSRACRYYQERCQGSDADAFERCHTGVPGAGSELGNIGPRRSSTDYLTHNSSWARPSGSTCLFLLLIGLPTEIFESLFSWLLPRGYRGAVTDRPANPPQPRHLLPIPSQPRRMGCGRLLTRACTSVNPPGP
jgi:hypothetical protein